MKSHLEHGYQSNVGEYNLVDINIASTSSTLSIEAAIDADGIMVEDAL